MAMKTKPPELPISGTYARKAFWRLSELEICQIKVVIVVKRHFLDFFSLIYSQPQSEMADNRGQ